MRIHSTVHFALGRLFPYSVKRLLKNMFKVTARVHLKKPYDPGFYPTGINLFGYLKAQMGIGQGSRLYAHSIAVSGLPHVLLNTTLVNPSRHKDTEFDGLLSNQPVYNTNIIHVNAEQLPALCASLPNSFWDGRYNIGVWLWELEDFPKEWHWAFQYLDEVWTPSTFTSSSIARISPIPVSTVPYGITAETDPKIDRRTFGLPESGFLFLTMFDVKSYVSRKNPFGAVEAFLEAFGDDRDDVGLVLKVLNATPRELVALQCRIRGQRNIHLLSDVLDKRVVNSLIRCCDAFVSLHRSEGFGLVLAEAMYMGVPVIATQWSGNTDFMDDGNSCPVSYTLIETADDYVWTKAGQVWADPDIHCAARHMIRLVEDTDFRNRIALAGQETIRSRFSLKRSAEAMVARLQEIGLVPAEVTSKGVYRP